MLRSQSVATQFHVRAGGVTRFGLTHDAINTVWLPLPPLPEQAAIVRYLSHADQRIRKVIAVKQRLIKLLQEQKQAIIHSAVTRGLDPHVRLKPSGVEWLGDVPEGWEVRRLKTVVKFNPAKTEMPFGKQQEVFFLPMEKVGVDGSFNYSERGKASEYWTGFTYFAEGDVLLAKITPCFENGKGGLLKNCPVDYGFGTTELIVMRPSEIIDGQFLRYITNTKTFLYNGESVMTGSGGQRRIPLDFVKNYPLALPPLPEQAAIVQYIERETATIAKAVARAEREIELLREYRTRLIADVVMGKLDVREAAAGLPEPAEAEAWAVDEAEGDVGEDDGLDDGLGADEEE